MPAAFEAAAGAAVATAFGAGCGKGCYHKLMGAAAIMSNVTAGAAILRRRSGIGCSRRCIPGCRSIAVVKHCTSVVDDRTAGLLLPQLVWLLQGGVSIVRSCSLFGVAEVAIRAFCS